MRKILLAGTALLLLACTRQTNESMVTSKPDINKKVVVYQVMTRLFGNTTTANVINGTKEENGVGKFDDFSNRALNELRSMGITHMWYTGVIEHAIIADYSSYGIAIDDADVVKGRAGSPYAIKDYYDVNPDLANDVTKRRDEFRQLIERTHQHGMKVIIDFVPNHVARSYISDAKPEDVADLGENDDKTSEYSPNNNFYYLAEPFQVPDGYEPIPGFSFNTKDGKFNETPAKATGNDKFDPKPSIYDWFETVKLNYGVDIQNNRTRHFEPIPDTWVKMKDILLYWTILGVDGFRCDMAEMVPVEFWGWAIPQVQQANPDIIFIAEIYNPQEYENYIHTGKFNFLYDKVELYDTLRHIIHGHGSTDNISPIIKNFETKSIDTHMLRFLENHDEQRLASRFFAGDPWKGWPGVVLSATISNGPMMIYFGQEVGEPGLGEEGFQGDDGRTTIFDYWGVPEHQKWVNDGKFDGGKLDSNQTNLRTYYSKLLNTCNSHEALQVGKTIDLHQYNLSLEDGYKNDKVYSFLKQTDNKLVLVACNFGAEKADTLTIALPDNLPAVNWTETSDLLTEKPFELRQSSAQEVQLSLDPYQAVILTFSK